MKHVVSSAEGVVGAIKHSDGSVHSRSIHSSARPSIRPSVHPSINSSIDPLIHPSTCTPTHSSANSLVLPFTCKTKRLIHLRLHQSRSAYQPRAPTDFSSGFKAPNNCNNNNKLLPSNLPSHLPPRNRC